MSYLKINNVFKSYDQKRVLNNISLDIEEGNFYVYSDLVDVVKLHYLE